MITADRARRQAEAAQLSELERVEELIDRASKKGKFKVETHTWASPKTMEETNKELKARKFHVDPHLNGCASWWLISWAPDKEYNRRRGR